MGEKALLVYFIECLVCFLNFFYGRKEFGTRAIEKKRMWVIGKDDKFLREVVGANGEVTEMLIIMEIKGEMGPVY